MSMEKESYYTKLDWLCEDYGFDIQYDFTDSKWIIMITDKKGELVFSSQNGPFSDSMPSDESIYNELIRIIRDQKLSQLGI
jgi:hypothetical protein